MGMVKRLWTDSDGQGVAEYAMMMAVVLTLLIAMIQLIGLRATDIFTHVASAIQ